MKKHLLGLGIFSFIVVSFGVVYAFLFAPKIPQVVEVRKPVYEFDKRNKCSFSERRSQKPSFRITHSTLLENNRKFNAIIEAENIDENAQFDLHYFVNDGKNVEYIATESAKVKKIVIESKFYWGIELNLDKWQKKFNNKNNFYFIPELTAEGNKSQDQNNIEFDSAKAIPVLWLKSPEIKEKTLD